MADPSSDRCAHGGSATTSDRYMHDGSASTLDRCVHDGSIITKYLCDEMLANPIKPNLLGTNVGLGVGMGYSQTA